MSNVELYQKQLDEIEKQLHGLNQQRAWLRAKIEEATADMRLFQVRFADHTTLKVHARSKREAREIAQATDVKRVIYSLHEVSS